MLKTVEYRDFNEMSIEELKAEFKLVCAKGITSDIKDRIASDRYKAAKKWNEELHLVSHIGDGFLCIDNITDERGIQDIYAEYKPSRKGAFEVYCDARKLGLKHFTITFQTSYYIYSCIEDKFAGEYPEQADDGENYDIVEYKAI